jgi:hypothetical protein
VNPGARPAVVVELLVEEKAPRVFVRCMTDGQEARIIDWIRSQDSLAELVVRALELAEEERAA